MWENAEPLFQRKQQLGCTEYQISESQRLSHIRYKMYKRQVEKT